MRKGEQTKPTILDKASQVFSVQVYAGASMDDLTRAAHLTKGGLYNHFDSKDDLALASFDHTMNLVYQRFAGLATGLRDTRSRLMAVLQLYASLIEEPVVPGGCPILYTAVEADDTHPALRERAQVAADSWRGYITRTLEKGIELGNVKPDVRPAATAELILAALEGAIVLAKLYGDGKMMQRILTNLTQTIDSLLLAPEPK